MRDKAISIASHMVPIPSASCPETEESEVRQMALTWVLEMKDLALGWSLPLNDPKASGPRDNVRSSFADLSSVLKAPERLYRGP